MINMKFLVFVISLSIYHGYSIWKMLWEGNFTLVDFKAMNMKIAFVAMLGNTCISRVVTIMSPCKSC